MAPHMVSISLFLDQLYKLESAAVSALSRLGSGSGSHTSTSTHVTSESENENIRVTPAPTSSRVTELPSVDAENDNNDDSVFSPLHSTTISTPIVTSTSSASKATSSATGSTLHTESINTKSLDVLNNKTESKVQQAVVSLEKVKEKEKEIEKEETDYVFAELDVYSSLTARDDGADSSGLRQRKNV